MLQSGYQTQISRFNLVPLLDVIFLLLIFFIFSMLSMVRQHPVTVQLPNINQTQAPLPSPTTITLDAENQFYWQDHQVTQSELLSEIARHYHADSQATFLIFADKSAHLGVALTLMDAMQQLGITQIAFATKGDAAP